MNLKWPRGLTLSLRYTGPTLQSFRGPFILVLSAALLGGCFAPMTTREAQDIASVRVTKYCAGRCGALTLGHTQKIKDRWLVDLDTPRQKFTVIVENDGNSKLTAWDKSRDASGQ